MRQMSRFQINPRRVSCGALALALTLLAAACGADDPPPQAGQQAPPALQVGRENVIAGSDCGFATFAGSDEIHPSIVWAKFEALVQGAEMASKQLWGR